MLLCPALELRNRPESLTSELQAQLQQLAQLGFDHVYVIDRDAQYGGQAYNLPVLRQLLEKTNAAVWAGGGIRELATVDALVQAGAARVVVGPSFWQQPQQLEQAVRSHGGKIIAMIDAYAGYVLNEALAQTNQRVLDQALWFERAGVAGILYMEHEREAHMGALNTEIIADLAFALTVPLYVTGGISALADLRALKAEAHTGIAGVILGRALLDGRIDPITAQALLNTKQAELS